MKLGTIFLWFAQKLFYIIYDATDDFKILANTYAIMQVSQNKTSN